MRKEKRAAYSVLGAILLEYAVVALLKYGTETSRLLSVAQALMDSRVFLVKYLVLLVGGAAVCYVLFPYLKVWCWRVGMALLAVFFLCDTGIAVTQAVEYRSEYRELLAYGVTETLPGIVCIGDSLTAGADSDYLPYPGELALLIEEAHDGIGIPVVNLGVGGEDAITITGRVGAIPYRLAAFEIPAAAEPVEVSFLLSEGKEVTPIANYVDTGINPCSIAGIAGRLTAEHEEDGLHYFFTRMEAGEAVAVEEGCELITDADGKYQDYIPIVYIGANGGYDDLEDLYRQQQAILAETNTEKYVIMTTTGDSREESAQLEAYMQERYGEHYLNLREYLSTQAIYDAGLEPTEEDLLAMEEGRVPQSLRKDAIHYNEYSTPLVAQLVYDKLLELGYLDEVYSYWEQFGE